MLSPTLTRRYTPPTCSLEIVAKTSALSQWSGNPVIKELRFELNLDDPRLAEEQKISLTGDRQQLEDLVEVVTDYVQNFLQDTNPVFDFAPTQNIFTYQTSGLGAGVSGASNVATITRPQLETKGLLSHRLHLGRLANEGSGQTIQLSATQLFDLANALEAYSADMLALPALTTARNRQTVMRWGAIAASVLIVVGISKTALQMQQQTQSPGAIANLEEVNSKPTEQLIPPNPHASYSFAPPPAAKDPDLIAKREGEAKVDLEAIAAKNAQTNNSSESNSAAAPKPAAKPQPVASAPPALPELASQALTFNDAARASAPLNRLQETQRYFKENWQVPEGLNDTLEYRLTIDPTGTLETVYPLGKAAELYQNRLPYLATGQAIVEPSDEQFQYVRLVLDPDGTVQTFADSDPLPQAKPSTPPK
jgi:hypothetical protein